MIRWAGKAARELQAVDKVGVDDGFIGESDEVYIIFLGGIDDVSSVLVAWVSPR